MTKVELEQEVKRNRRNWLRHKRISAKLREENKQLQNDVNCMNMSFSACFSRCTECGDLHDSQFICHCGWDSSVQEYRRDRSTPERRRMGRPGKGGRRCGE